jgi:hypothetical protein
MTNVLDKQCSRNQIEVVVSNLRKEVTIIRRGANPSYLQKKGQPIQDMDKDAPYPIKNGDKFYLVVDRHPFVLQTVEQEIVRPILHDDEPPAKKPKVEKPKTVKEKPKKEAAPKTVNLMAKKKKPSKSSEEDEKEPNEYDLNSSFIDNYEDKPRSWRFGTGDEDDDDVLKEGMDFVKRETQRYKKKGEEDEDGSDPDTVDGKPRCKYGAACYRTNPMHIQQFYHPPKGENTRKSPRKKAQVKYGELPELEDHSNGEEENGNAEEGEDEDLKKALKLSEQESKGGSQKMEKQSSSVKALHELFKGIEPAVIEQILEEVEGDQDKAVTALMKITTDQTSE